MNDKTIEKIIFTLCLPALVAITLIASLPFTVLLAARFIIFLILLASYPLLLILAKLPSKHWNPRNPFKFIKDTAQSLPYLWQKIYELCLPSW